MSITLKRILAALLALLAVSVVLHLLWAGPQFLLEYPQSALKTLLYTFRLPRTAAALLCGLSLPVSGLLLQLLFRNPMAGPYVLGISSGASVMVALVMMGSTVWFSLKPSSVLIIPAALTGSLMVMGLMLFLSHRIKNPVVVLLCGVLISQFLGAAEGLLAVFAQAQELQNFWFWNLGFIPVLDHYQLLGYALVVIMCLIGVVWQHAKIQSLLLGPLYAQSMGVHLTQIRLIIMLSASLLTALTTAFCGPIAFIGMSLPILSRIWFKTSHMGYQIIFVALLGSILMLHMDLLSQQLLKPRALPINIISSCFGIPIVLWAIIKEKNFMA